MRKLVTGTDVAGRSCLVEDTEIHFEGVEAHGLAMANAHAVDTGPESGLRLEGAHWIFLDWEPDSTFDMHRTDTFDFDLVLAGGGDLVLEDGAHPVGEGDAIIMTGVMHAWRTGPMGCRLSVLTVPFPPPA